MFAYYFMRKRKFIPYVLLVLLAASFHKIALIAIPLYFLLNIKYKAYWYGIGAAISLLLAVFHRQILDFIYNYAFTFYKAIEKENTGYSLVNIGITLA
ncbi:MAG: EpsG family protein, partial [Oscillospiraceae bacterium]